MTLPRLGGHHQWFLLVSIVVFLMGASFQKAACATQLQQCSSEHTPHTPCSLIYFQLTRRAILTLGARAEQGCLSLDHAVSFPLLSFAQWAALGCIGALLDESVLQLSLFCALHTLSFLLLVVFRPFANRYAGSREP